VVIVLEAGALPSSTLTVDGARCAAHPERAALAVCARCGDYHCADCQKTVGERSLCASCRALPGVDYLEDTRRRYWGKRDGFVWYFGAIGSLGMLVALPRHLANRDYFSIATSLVWLVLSIGYLTLAPWSRRALLFGTLALGLWGVVQAALGLGTKLTEEQLRMFGGRPGALAFSAVAGLVAALIALAAYQSPRNKLAFKLPVSDADLAKVYDVHVSNALARRAFWYGLVFTMIPFASAITLVMGLVAFRRGTKGAWPPRGGRKPAMTAIVISSLALSGWAAFFVSIAMRVR